MGCARKFRELVRYFTICPAGLDSLFGFGAVINVGPVSRGIISVFDAVITNHQRHHVEY